MINELILAGVTFFHPQARPDSLGIETINGKVFVIHKVAQKETLYAIARRYGASVEGIRQTNPGLGDNLEVGQILKIPYTRTSGKPQPAAGTSNPTIHKVAPKETMYAISRQYGVSVDDIKQWNQLKDNNLAVGQEIIVKNPGKATTTVTTPSHTTPTQQPATTAPKAGTHTVAARETLYAIARQYEVTMQQLRDWNKLDQDELRPGQVLVVASPEGKNTKPRQEPVVTTTEPKRDPEPVKPKVEEPKTDPRPANTPVSNPPNVRISESVKNSDEVTEAGIAELIEGTEGNRKYLALHRTAPVGTILKVKNEMNNREVFVRVMGKLPDTALTDKLVIKISRSAYDRLGAIDPRFRVEVTYYK